MAALTGRISAGPTELLRTEVLEPQFRYEAGALLHHYVHLEKVLLLEFRRMAVLPADQVAAIARALDEITADRIVEGMGGSMSDMAFAIERFVLGRLDAPAPAWHADRSRNDLQACAQLMAAREITLAAAAELAGCAAAAIDRVGPLAHDVMPGYTHLQAAQVVSPGFHLAALSGRLLHALARLSDVYDGFDACPLGSGAMAGQELDWDRHAMSELLGFARPEPHALTAVASREWLLELAGACSTTGVVLSRFTTDLMAWTSSAYGFCELPDELAGISSAMPQKKNYPILERIRGRTAHLTAWYVDVATTQRAVPYANSVETSKEGSALLPTAMSSFTTALGLLRAVLDGLEFRADRMRAACEREFLGGFALANRLTLDAGVPWRTAQVITGAYITAAMRAGHAPADVRPDLLATAAETHGHSLSDPAVLLADVFNPDAELARKRSYGAAAPDLVLAARDEQAARLTELTGQWRERRRVVDDAVHRVDHLLGTRP
ncbi:argininosuccinate lyase [Kutzneria sp. 744]|uniref:argininosuccinate lyase n=1 Tax=Kutzneria sp. (strain 744) TaxID=345341 RepID=UPI0004B523BC|nr:lyase family protein [Kutzneria sp. 744]